MLPGDLREAVEAAVGRVTRINRIDGGMINEAAAIDTVDGRFFLKWRDDAPEGFFQAEADGLALLRQAGKLRVPKVIASSEAFDPSYRGMGVPACERHTPPPVARWASRPSGPKAAFLLLEYIEQTPPAEPGRFTRNFAEALAETHRAAVAPDGRYGLDRDNFIGLLPQRNDPRKTWAEFYRDCRLIPQIDIARRAGRLNESRERLLLRVLDCVDDLLSGHPRSPSLLHGDLWSGNYLTVVDHAVVVDPSVYYGDREVEIAFIELFGGFPPGFVRAYSDAYPLDPGYPDRRKLLQLYPLLNHLNTFGESYGPAVEDACRQYV